MLRACTRLSLALALAVALYSLAGFLLAPRILLHYANQQLAQSFAVPARLQNVVFNPFLLTFRLEGFSLGLPDAPKLTLPEVTGRLDWDSLWRGELHIEHIDAASPELALVIDASGTLNAASWLAPRPATPTAPASDSATLFPLSLDRLSVSSARINFEDRRFPTPLVLTVEPLEIHLKQLTTRGQSPASIELLARGPGSSTLQGHGQLWPAPLRSEGTVQVIALDLVDLSPYLESLIPLALQQGRLTTGGDYHYEPAGKTPLVVKKGHLEITELALGTADGEPLLNLPLLRADGIRIDHAARRLNIGRVQSSGLEAWLSRAASGAWNWPLPPASTTEGTTDNWQFRVGELKVEDYQLHLRDELPQQPVSLEIGPLSASVNDYRNFSDQPINAQLHTRIGRHGQLSLQGQIEPSSARARLAVQAQELDLRLAQSYIAPFLDVDLRSGLLSSNLDVALYRAEPLGLELSGNARISQFDMRDRAGQRDLVRWRQLDLSGLSYRHGQRLEIAAADLHEPYARLVIFPDQTTNLGRLLKNSPAPAAPARSGPPTPAIDIGTVRIHNGMAHFSDLSLRPNFVTDIQQLQGHIGAISHTRPITTVNLQGKVDRYAPVHIQGELAPFDPLSKLDISARFDQMELTTLTPYAAKFAGYRIRKGRMNLGLHYRITDRRLEADHDIVIEQLQLGERVDSPDAVDLPVRLAVALLKDSDGTIRLNLPVQGDLNNPQFEMMPLVWKTLGNLIARAARSPFRLISGLVSADERNLSSIAFDPGSSELDEAAREQLAQLAMALRQRPQLRLDIEGAASPWRDGPSVASERLEQALRVLWYEELQRQGERLPSDAVQLQVPEAHRPRLIGRLHQRWLAPTQATFPTQSTEQRITEQEAQLLQYWSTNESLLRTLGRARAATIKDYLVDVQGLDDQRVFQLDTRVSDHPDTERVISQLHLGSR